MKKRSQITVNNIDYYEQDLYAACSVVNLSLLRTIPNIVPTESFSENFSGNVKRLHRHF